MNIWQSIQSEIQDATQTEFNISQKISVTGGDINQAFRLIGNNCEYFVKLNSANNYDMFCQESVGLKALRKSERLKIPQTILYGLFENQSYLVLEYLDLKSNGEMEKFAVALAQLHLNTQNNFGFACDNYIGKTVQINAPRNNWGEFFAEQRIGFQLSLLQQKGVPQSLIKKGQQLVQRLPIYLNKHQPRPALIHGDLWQGNYSFDPSGMPVIYDPACYYADHEVDLAMLELFGNPGPAFFKTYSQTYPIENGYTMRKKIYNLYHILNHANLFGGRYISQSEHMIKGLIESNYFACD